MSNEPHLSPEEVGKALERVLAAPELTSPPVMSNIGCGQTMRQGYLMKDRIIQVAATGAHEIVVVALTASGKVLTCNPWGTKGWREMPDPELEPFEP
jgi:hypothetical protein